MSDLYIGIMSGTSLDAVDVVLARFSPKIHIEASVALEFPQSLQDAVRQLCVPGNNEIDRMGEINYQLAEVYSKSVQALLNKASVGPGDIRAIGLHGQTIRHRPDSAFPFTLQIGDAAVLAHLTGIPVVADFRSADIAAGGQGAPLVPAFHAGVFRSKSKNRIILNLGGIANITVLPADKGLPIRGYDTGPANVLMDEWIREHEKLPCDKNGAWAARGQVNEKVLNLWLEDPFFAAPAPKSTGREYFTLDWMKKALRQQEHKMAGVDIQASLAELSASTISEAINSETLAIDEVYVCGGGVHNDYLMQRIQAHLKGAPLKPVSELGMDPDFVEAACFAWLAKARLDGEPGNVPEVTGASQPKVLGAVYLP